MSESEGLPVRYNPWGEWNPLVGRGSEAEYFDVLRSVRQMPSLEAKAVSTYCAYSRFNGIEFVAVSRYLDCAERRDLPNSIVLRPCDDVRGHCQEDIAGPSDPAPWFVYDGWCPLPDASLHAILRGVALIDRVITGLGFVHGVPTRWVPKYVEAVNPVPRRTLGDEDWLAADEFASQLETLPEPVADAVVRAARLYQFPEAALAAADRFLALYIALEGLCGALWEHATAVGLPIPRQHLGETRPERRARQEHEIRAILLEQLESDPAAAVRRCYFDVIGSIRRQVELVLAAMLGEGHEFIAWLFSDRDGAPAPSKLRGSLAHGGISGIEQQNVEAITRAATRLEPAVKALIGRVLQRRWAGQELDRRQLRYVMRVSVDETPVWVQGGEIASRTGRRITPGLLAAKGLL